MSKGIVLPISMKTEMYDSVASLVKNGRFKTKGECFRTAFSQFIRRDKRHRFVCDFCYKKFSRFNPPNVSTRYTKEGYEVVKLHEKCKNKLNPVKESFDEVFDGTKVSA